MTFLRKKDCFYPWSLGIDGFLSSGIENLHPACTQRPQFQIIMCRKLVVMIIIGKGGRLL